MNYKKAILNQNKIFNLLKQSKLNNRLSHAYLFYGENGVGKKEMAYDLACLLYCPNGGCLECQVCQSIMNNQHMNVEYIGIDENKTMISKEQITSLQEEFSKTSLIEGSRVYIVDGIDTASMAAQNSLLKFIEEPINNTQTIGIFLATDSSNVVSTILSRCALIHFEAIDFSTRVKELVDDGIDLMDSTLACSLTNSIDEAIDYTKSISFQKGKELFLNFIKLSKQKEGVLFYLQNLDFYSDASNVEILLKWLLLFLDDAIKVFKGSDGLLLKPLYDTIIAYNTNNKLAINAKLKLVSDLLNKLRYNISAKNVFHELIVKFI